MEYNLLHEKHCYRKEIISKNPHNIGFVNKKKGKKKRKEKPLEFNIQYLFCNIVIVVSDVIVAWKCFSLHSGKHWPKMTEMKLSIKEK